MMLRHVCTTSDPAAGSSPRHRFCPLGESTTVSRVVLSPPRPTGISLYACGIHRNPAWHGVMLNPSTADAHRNDATVRRCINTPIGEGSHR
jgi:Protein of unknown function (DUF1643)